MQGSGIYQIINKISGKRYIGSTVNLRKRWTGHYSALRHGTHANAHLQNAWNLYGPKAFAFSVLEYVLDLERLTEREQHYFDALQPEYNLAPTAGTNLGFKYTVEARAKLSEARKGTVFSEEARRNMSAAQRGRVHTEETKRKMSEANRGTANGNAKLSEQDILEIRALLEESVLPQREIAARYGVGRQAINYINTGRTWSHSDNGAICDFCRFAAHNGPDALPHMTSDSYCTKHKRAVRLYGGCDDFECWRGEVAGWRDESPIVQA